MPFGGSVDQFGSNLVVTFREETPNPLRDTWYRALRDRFRPSALIAKTRSVDPRRSASKVVFGDVEPDVLVREGPSRYIVRLDEGFQTGLFLDLRPLRDWLSETSGTGETLNLFAYTGSLSVRAAMAGSRRVTSVDASRRALRWARQNMQVSGQDPDRHRWFRDDVMTFLRRVPDARYQTVIADPPATGSSGSKRFHLRHDLHVLMKHLVRVTRPGGHLAFATHDPTSGPAHIEAVLTKAMRDLDRRGTMRRLDSDFDFPTNGADFGPYLTMVVTTIHLSP